MMNSNPETVSTDYDTSSRLYFEPLTVEDVLNVLETERPDGIIVQFGGQTPLKLAGALQEALTKNPIPAASGEGCLLDCYLVKARGLLTCPELGTEAFSTAHGMTGLCKDITPFCKDISSVSCWGSSEVSPKEEAHGLLTVVCTAGDGNVRIWGTSPESIDEAEDRDKWYKILTRLDIKQPPGDMVVSEEQALQIAQKLGYPVMVRPSFVLGGRAMEIVYTCAPVCSPYL